MGATTAATLAFSESFKSSLPELCEECELFLNPPIFFRVIFVQHWSSVGGGQKYPEKARGRRGTWIFKFYFVYH